VFPCRVGSPRLGCAGYRTLGGDTVDTGSPLERYQEIETGEAFALQNPRLLRVELSQTSVMAKNGSMVAYQGDVRFDQRRRRRAAAQEGGDWREPETHASLRHG
jgi:hypothetical protein